MHSRRFWWIIAATLAACAGDDGDDGDGGGGEATSGSCTVTGIQCMAYSGPVTEVAAAQASCTAEGDTWSSAACSTTSYVGTCTVTQSGTSGSVTVVTTYYPVIYDAAGAQADCSSSSMQGTWAAGNTTGGSTGGTNQSFGCQPTGEPFCTDVSGEMTAQRRAELEAVCTSGPGTVTTACETANRTGSCAYAMSGLSFVDRFYVVAQAAEDAAICVANAGTWTPN